MASHNPRLLFPKKTGRGRSTAPLADEFAALPTVPLFSSPASPRASPGSKNSNMSSASASSSSGNTDAIMGSKRQHSRRKLAQDIHNRALSKKALMENDAMVYLDGPQVYTCGNCRTHLTSHDDIISKSFHGRHGRAYLFDQCVNITTGPPEDRYLITGLHSVSDIFCKRCQTLVGWTYAKAYEPTQKYKEGKFIIEKINLHLEESDYYTVDRPAGERGDRWRVRSMSWGSERSLSVGSYGDVVMGSPSGVMGSPTGGSCYSRGGGAACATGGAGNSSTTGNSSYASSCHRPPVPQTPTRRSPGLAMLLPKSPRSPSDIIYEYRRGEAQNA